MSISIFCKFSVPLFFAIFGALMLGREPEFLKKLWTQRILRMMMLLLVWSFFYYLVEVYWNNTQILCIYSDADDDTVIAAVCKEFKWQFSSWVVVFKYFYISVSRVFSTVKIQEKRMEQKATYITMDYQYRNNFVFVLHDLYKSEG